MTIRPIWLTDRYKVELKQAKERYNIPEDDERFNYLFMEGWQASIRVMRESLGKETGDNLGDDDGRKD